MPGSSPTVPSLFLVTPTIFLPAVTPFGSQEAQLGDLPRRGPSEQVQRISFVDLSSWQLCLVIAMVPLSTGLTEK